MLQQSAFIIRLKTVMQQRSINARELAERAGVGASFVYDILNGNSRNPTTAKLRKVAEVLGVSLDYLLEGKLADPAEKLDMVQIPQLAVAVTAEGMKLTELSGLASPWKYHRGWLEKELGVPVEHLRAFEVRDNAMAPALQPGDMALVDVRENTPPLVPGVYTVMDRFGLVLRRVEDGLAKADNTAARITPRKVEEVNIVGRVVWSARKFV